MLLHGSSPLRQRFPSPKDRQASGVRSLWPGFTQTGLCMPSPRVCICACLQTCVCLYMHVYEHVWILVWSMCGACVSMCMSMHRPYSLPLCLWAPEDLPCSIPLIFVLLVLEFKRLPRSFALTAQEAAFPGVLLTHLLSPVSALSLFLFPCMLNLRSLLVLDTTPLLFLPLFPLCLGGLLSMPC